MTPATAPARPTAATTRRPHRRARAVTALAAGALLVFPASAVAAPLASAPTSRAEALARVLDTEHEVPRPHRAVVLPPPVVALPAGSEPTD